MPLLFAVGFIAQFALGGMTGVMLAVFPVDWQLTDTYFVVAHMHHVLFGGVAFGIMAGLYYWFPKMSGRMLSEGLGKLSFWLMVIGFNVSLPAPVLGRPVRDAAPDLRVQRRRPDGVQRDLHDRLLHPGGRRAGDGLQRGLEHPQGAPSPDRTRGLRTRLEWFTPSPPPQHNFDVIPTVRSLEPMKDIRRAIQEREAAARRSSDDVTEPPSKQPEPIP